MLARYDRGLQGTPSDDTRAWWVALAMGAMLATGCTAEVADGVAPVILRTIPEDGDAWERRGEIRFEFSEPMSMRKGTIELFLGPDRAPHALDGVWQDAERTTFVAWPREQLPQNADVVVVADGFADREGHALRAPRVVELRTLDDAAPALVRTSPVEGAVLDATALAEVVFEFDEPLDGAAGRVELEGFEITAGPIRWGLGGRQVRVPVSGLWEDHAYSVTLRGFRDYAGRYAPASSVTFRTTPDLRGPGLVAAWPAEGAVVDANAVDEIRVTFDEPMRTDSRTTLVVDGEACAVWGTWEGPRDTFVVPVDALPPGARVSLSLAGFHDWRGNATDPTRCGEDGRLDFLTR